jgi:hypothetical protein
MPASDQDRGRQDAGPVVITVDGTFAGNLGKQVPHWWQIEATLASELKNRPGAIVEPF